MNCFVGRERKMSSQTENTHLWPEPDTGIFSYGHLCLHMILDLKLIFSTYCTSMLKPLILPPNTLGIVLFFFEGEPCRGQCFGFFFLILSFRETNRISQNNSILSTYHFSLFLLKKSALFFGKGWICNAIPIG